MGYRSDVKILVALPTAKAREEVMALYAMHPTVQKHEIAKQWEAYEQTFDNVHDGKSDVARPITAYLLTYEDEYVKWYEGYEDVEAVNRMLELLKELGDANEDFTWAYKFIRVGESMDDIEVSREWSDDSDAVGDLLDDFVSEILDISVEITLDIRQDEAR